MENRKGNAPNVLSTVQNSVTTRKPSRVRISSRLRKVKTHRLKPTPKVISSEVRNDDASPSA